jgi:hypothetical protein
VCRRHCVSSFRPCEEMLHLVSLSNEPRWKHVISAAAERKLWSCVVTRGASGERGQ